jgi:hypothetical protein
MKITEALIAEHVVFHNLFDYAQKTIPRLKTLAEVKSLAALLASLLEAHSQTEEELIVQPLEHCLEQLGQRETFHQEHDEIDKHLRHAQAARNVKQARHHVMIAVAASRCHFDKEERIVFPMAEKCLKSKTLTALGKIWIERREAMLS